MPARIQCAIGCNDATRGLSLHGCCARSGILVKYNTSTPNDLKKFVDANPDVIAITDIEWSWFYQTLRGIPATAILASTGDLPQTRLKIVSIVDGQSSREIALALKLGAIDYFPQSFDCDLKCDVIRRVDTNRPEIGPDVAQELEQMIAPYTNFTPFEIFILHELASATPMSAILNELTQRFHSTFPYTKDHVAIVVRNILLRLHRKR